MGRSFWSPMLVRQVSTLQPSHAPLPFASKYHCPVLGRKTPMDAAVFEVKFAVTDTFAPSVTVQLPTPLQPPPLQPKKVAPGSACGVSVILAPLVEVMVQVEPQSMPEGE